MGDIAKGDSQRPPRILDRIIRFSLERRVVTLILFVVLVAMGGVVAPFDWDIDGVERDPVPVDAIPDIGENQQIVYTEWPGRSPRDIEDQITYPLTASLMGMPGVRTVRSYSMFGLSTIYVIFEEDVEFYWSRSRILEKLSSLSPGTLPAGASPSLGPDATALGQVFWYTLEGHDPSGRPVGGWDLHELRSIQDWQVRFHLMSVPGVAEVASVGGFVREYQVDVDPDSMRAHGVTLDQVFKAVAASNADVGARTLDMNGVEYVIRGIGFLKGVEDLEQTVVTVRDNTPIYLSGVAKVALGPALRRGALDKGGAETVGGVVVVRHGANPLEVIEKVRDKIEALAPSLPSRTLADGTISRVTIERFYDRTGLIEETLDTLGDALYGEILVTIIVVLVMLMHLRSSALISSLLPMAILMTFVAMKYLSVDANIVALSGIAIAIGTMVDMGIVVCENILKHLDAAPPGESRLEVVYRATSEVGSAVLTAIATTVVSFLPILTMGAAEGGKLFTPLALTKTFAILASVVVALIAIPPAAQILFTSRVQSQWLRRALHAGLVAVGLVVIVTVAWWAGLLVALIGAYHLSRERLPESARPYVPYIANGIAVLAVLILLATHWSPLGVERSTFANALFVTLMVAPILGAFALFHRHYESILRWCLSHKLAFLAAPAAMLVAGGTIWAGLGKEFMPSLDEGSFLYMPSIMPHGTIGEALDVLQKQDTAIAGVPEVENVVGKIGRAESPLDPAPVSMVETVINYLPEFKLNGDGSVETYSYDPSEPSLFADPSGTPVPAPDGKPYYVRGTFERNEAGQLIADASGQPFRHWRPALDPMLNPGRDYWPGINAPRDIWDAIAAAAEVPGSTSAPMLQPIETRLVMLQTGMRSSMGVKVSGPTVEAVEALGLAIEKALRDVPSIKSSTVTADRIVAKPYVEIVIDRRAIARYGISVRRVQDVIETAIGGRRITTTVEGIERYPVRIRYPRELRDSVQSLSRVLVPAPDGTQIPLIQLAELRHTTGPQVLRSENALPVGYVIFDKQPGRAEVDVVTEAQQRLKHLIENNSLDPGEASYEFVGTYENQVKSEDRLKKILPLALAIIFVILYLQFRSTVSTMIVFSGIAVAWAGGFMMIWLYGQGWFLNVEILGVNIRELFNIETVNLSTAVWVGFLALFGIATDDGVVMTTYLNQVFTDRKPSTAADIREATVFACKRRVRPALMTTATTLLALLPVLTSTGRGSDIMVPMAIPTFGGMVIAMITLFVVPVLYESARVVGLNKSDTETDNKRNHDER